jgi:hypothetical protein
MDGLKSEESISDNTKVEGNLCVHHWIIGNPEGPTSMGTCKICGVDKEFANFFEGSSWGTDVSLDSLRNGGSRSNGPDYSKMAETVKTEETF